MRFASSRSFETTMSRVLAATKRPRAVSNTQLDGTHVRSVSRNVVETSINPNRPTSTNSAPATSPQRLPSPIYFSVAAPSDQKRGRTHWREDFLARHLRGRPPEPDRENSAERE